MNPQQILERLQQGAQAIAALRVLLYQAGGTVVLTAEARDAISPTAVVIGNEEGDNYRLTLEEPQATGPNETEAV